MMNATFPTARHVLPYFFRGYRLAFVGYWVVLALVYLGIGYGVARFNTIEESVWEDVGVVPGYFLMVIGILATLWHISTFVRNGMTRHHYVLGTSVFGITLAAMSAILMLVGFGIERAIFRMNNWPHLVDGTEFFASASNVPERLAIYLILFATYYFGGCLIGTAFSHFGHWREMWAFPLSVLLITAVEILFPLGGLGNLLVRVLGIGSLPLGVALIAGCGVAALTWVLNYRVTRMIAINP